MDGMNNRSNRFDPEATVIFCAKCGTPLPPDSKFCTHCGAVIGTRTPAPAAAQKETNPFPAVPDAAWEDTRAFPPTDSRAPDMRGTIGFTPVENQNEKENEGPTDFTPVKEETPAFTPVEEVPAFTPVEEETSAFAPAIEEETPAFTPAEEEASAFAPAIEETAPAFTLAEEEAPAFTPVEEEERVIVPAMEEEPAFTPAVEEETPAFAPVEDETPAFAPAAEETPAFTPAEEPAEAPAFTPAEAVPMRRGAYMEPASVFAEGLPDWDIEPPQILVRRR